MNVKALTRNARTVCWPPRSASRARRLGSALTVAVASIWGVSIVQGQTQAPNPNVPRSGRISEVVAGQLNDLPAGASPQLRVAQGPRPAPAGAGPIQVPSVDQAPVMIDPTVEPEGPVPGLGADRFRLPLMGEPGTPLGATPRATPEVQQEFNQYVERTVDPENTFDLVVKLPTTRWPTIC